MTVDLPAFYAEMERRLDERKVADAADSLRSAIAQGVPTIIDYCPGNATRYVLVFTPSWACHGDERALVNGVGTDIDTVLVSHVNGPAARCYAFSLDRPETFEVPYVQDKLMVSAGDAVPIAALIREAATPQ